MFSFDIYIFFYIYFVIFTFQSFNEEDKLCKAD